MEANIQSLKAGIVFPDDAPATANRRYVLVIGNRNYEHQDELQNAEKDAKDMAALLQECGFHVSLGLDLNAAELLAAFEEFAANPDLTGGMVVVYYAGHAYSNNGINYMVPTDEKLENPISAARKSLPVEAGLSYSP